MNQSKNLNTFDQVVRFFATGCGLGNLPKAPGTFGSLWGPLLFFILFVPHQPWIYAALAFLGSLISIVIADLAEQSYGEKDCQKIVIDEVAGMLLTYLWIPFSWPNAILGFLLFRLFDVVKLYPANWAQARLKGGLGVVADDLVAGLQACAILHAANAFLWPWLKSLNVM